MRHTMESRSVRNGRKYPPTARLVSRIVNSNLATKSHIRAKELFKAAIALQGPIPPNWDHWLQIIEKFEREDTIDMDVWRDVVQVIRALCFETPLETSQLKIGAISQISAPRREPSDDRELWNFDVLSFPEPTDANMFGLYAARNDVGGLISKLKGQEFKSIGVEASFKSRSTKLGHENKF